MRRLPGTNRRWRNGLYAGGAVDVGGVARESRRGCRPPQLRADPSLAGRVHVTLSIASDGAVAAAHLDGSPLNEAFRRCLTGSMVTWRFPGPGNGHADVEFPLILQARVSNDR